MSSDARRGGYLVTNARIVLAGDEEAFGEDDAHSLHRAG